jgi:hypothetical protein
MVRMGRMASRSKVSMPGRWLNCWMLSYILNFCSHSGRRGMAISFTARSRAI